MAKKRRIPVFILALGFIAVTLMGTAGTAAFAVTTGGVASPHRAARNGVLPRIPLWLKAPLAQERSVPGHNVGPADRARPVLTPPTMPGRYTPAVASTPHASPSSSSPLRASAVPEATQASASQNPVNDTYAATSLQASGRWSAGSNTGAFTWSDPITVPPALGGAAPKVALGYNSSSVDGRTLATNSQSSWIGEGFDYQPGFIERSFKSCKDEGDGSTRTQDANKNTITVTGDQCWAGQNATINFAGHSTELVRDDSSSTPTNTWRLADDDGSSLQLLTGAANGSGGTGGTNGDGATGEYWKLTTTDGTSYYFGSNHLPGGNHSDSATGSTWTEPVYSNYSGQPCYYASFASSWCQLAWRWNLDYVIDPHGNLTTYTYTQETNAYARGAGTGTVTSYIRGGTLASITYGIRQTDLAAAGGAGTAKPAAQVMFTTAERCVTSSASGAVPCTAAGRAAATTTAQRSQWPDTPLDQACATSATSCTQHSPTFWSTLRLSQIDTQVLSGTIYKTIDTYVLTPDYPPTNESPLKPAMTLKSVLHKGQDGGTLAMAQPVSFGYTPLPNLVAGSSTGLTLLHRNRLTLISTEAGENISVTYSSPQCTQATQANPVAIMPASADSNTYACYPAWWTPAGASNPVMDWFNVYTVQQVVESDNTSAGSPATVTSYSYGGGAAWHRDDSETTVDKYREWDQFRGFQSVDTMTGQAGSGVVTSTVTTYMRGMNGDATATAGVTKSVSVPVPNGKASTITDDNWLAGFARETDTYTQEGGSLVSASYNDPSVISNVSSVHNRPNTGGVTLPPLVSHLVVDVATTKVELVSSPPGQADSSGKIWRTSKVSKTYNNDGLVLTVDDTGDSPGNASATDPERCTSTTYATSPTGAYMVDYPSTVMTYAGPCVAGGATSTSSVSGTQTLYDHSSTPGTIVSVGDVTSVSPLSTWNAATSTAPATPVFSPATTGSSDVYGRPVSSTDVLGTTTTTAYTPTTGALPTSIATQKTVNSNLWKTTTTLDPGRAQPLTVTDLNNEVTATTYDPLGRLTAVWKPGRTKGTDTADLTYTYSVPGTPTPTTTGSATPPAVTTATVHEDGSYGYDIKIYDGLLRLRQEQSSPEDGSHGRVLTDTFYDYHGWVIKTNNPYYDNKGATAPNTILFVVADNAVDGQNATFYDGMGRPTAQTYSSRAVELWRTSLTYPGLDRVDSTPPDGGTATTVYSDARGHTTARWEYTTEGPTGNAADADKTTYSYDAGDHDTGVTDAAGNQWTYHYDLRGRVIESDDPDAGISKTSYTQDSQPQLVTTPTGTVGYVYDANGRKTALRSGSTTGPLLSTWTYDGVAGAWGQLSSSSRYDNGNVYTSNITGYTVRYQPTTTTVIIPASEGALASTSSNQYTVNSTYYAETGLHYSDTYSAAGGLPSENLYYSYNQNDTPAGVGGLTYYDSNIAWNPYGQLSATGMGPSNAQITLTPSYDAGTHRPIALSVNNQAKPSAAVDAISYAYNANGDTTAIKDIRSDGSNSQGTDTQCFSYDHHDRLTQAWTDTAGLSAPPSQSNGGLGGCTSANPSVNSTGSGAAGTVGGPAPYWQQWTYDLAGMGNRTSETDHSTDTTGAGTTTTYSYNAAGSTSAQPHAAASTTTTDLTSQATVGTATYQHNGGGQTITRPAPGNGRGTQTLTYTVDGHLASLTQTGGSTPGTTSYVYDANGNQLIRRSPGSSTLYAFGQEITAVTSGAQAGTVSGVRYYPNPGGTSSTVVRSSSGAITYQVADPHGTGSVAIDATTNTVIRRDTTPYGNSRFTSSGGVTPSFPWIGQKGFLGGTLDPDAGLTLLNARNYDPSIGEFTTVDPVVSSDPDQLNAYSYAYGNPITRSDPTGLRPDPDDDPSWKPPHPGSGGTNPSPPSEGVTSSSASSDSTDASGSVFDNSGADDYDPQVGEGTIQFWRVRHDAAKYMWVSAALQASGQYDRGIFTTSDCDPYVSYCVEFPVPGGAYGNDKRTGRVDIAAGIDGPVGPISFYEVKHEGNEDLAGKQLKNYIGAYANSGGTAVAGRDLVHRVLSEPDPLDPKNRILYAEYKEGGYIAWWTERRPDDQSETLVQHWLSRDYMPQWLQEIVGKAASAAPGGSVSSPDPVGGIQAPDPVFLP